MIKSVVTGHFLRWMIWLGLVAAGLAACQRSSVERSPALPTTSLKVGVLLPTTGLAAVGTPVLEVLPLIGNTINACGGVNAAPLSLLVEDEPLDPKTEAALVNRLAADQVSALVGGFAGNSSTQAGIQAAVKQKIPLISPSNTSPVFTAQAQKGDFQGYWARTVPADTAQAIALARLARNRGFKTASTLVVNDSSGVQFEQAFVSAFEKLGGTILNKANPTRYRPQDGVFDAEAAAAFSPGRVPDAVVADLDPNTGSLLLQSAYAQGLTEGIQLLFTDRLRNTAFLKSVGQTETGNFLLEGAIGTTPNRKTETSSSFLKLWREKQTAPPGKYVSQTWDAVALIALAAQAARSNRGEDIKNQLQQVANPPGEPVSDLCEALQLAQDGQEIDYQGASGNVNIDTNGDVISDYDVWTVDMQGQFRQVGQVKMEP